MAKFIALAPRRDDQPRMPWTINGRLIVDTEQAWEGMPHDGLVRVPVNTLGSPVSMLDSPLAKVTPWWQDEDKADGDQSA